jgi:hypothetical protein
LSRGDGPDTTATAAICDALEIDAIIDGAAAVSGPSPETV